MDSKPPDSNQTSSSPPDEHVHTAGPVSTDGGDFIGRDKHVYGDEVRGNKVTIQQVLSEADLQDQNNRRVLRQRVKSYWIEGVLDHSLNHEAAIRLHITDRSTLVANRPWRIIPQHAAKPAQLLPLIRILLMSSTR